MLTLPADTGDPMSATLVATAEVQRHAFQTMTRQVSLRNTGKNTLWVSLDNGKWFDVAGGTAWEERVSVEELRYCTQLGKATFSLVGVALISGGD
jgi:hypothetical protein